MKRLLVLSLVALTLIGCGNHDNGELVGVRKKTKHFEHKDPYGMVFVPMGSFTMGVGGQDITSRQTAQPRTISVSAFFMDETEITNNEYREFVYWVRDSIARYHLRDVEGFAKEANGDVTSDSDYAPLNWDAKIEWNNPEHISALEEGGMYIKYDESKISEIARELGGDVPVEVVKGKLNQRAIDPKQLYYQYFWIDFQAAAKKEFNGEGYDYRDASFSNRTKDLTSFIRYEKINVYPDTMSWVHDYAYSYNTPLTEKYFWHVAYDNYPVVGVNWNQAKAFCVWRTEKLNKYLSSQKGETTLSEFRLPTEAEWEWAARGGNHLNPYPWGGPYTRTAQGCFVANFKPLRGNYIADGGLRTLIVAHYPANDWGLYDMAGNVSEWTNSAYDPISYNYVWDMNPTYTYNAKAEDPAIMKRKVIRGGSWKDIAYYMEVSTRDYEYQDTAKCYIGFRCIQPYLGRNKGDNSSKESHVYGKKRNF